MNKNILIPITQFVLLVLAQVIIFNNINFLGYLNPYPYILFLLLFPFTSNRSLYIIIAFVTGIIMDMFGDSGGIHTAACLTLAYFRPVALRFAFGVSYEYNAIRISQASLYERFVYITIMVFIHHLALFFLEVFNISSILYILQKTLFTSIFTILLCILFTILFGDQKK